MADPVVISDPTCEHGFLFECPVCMPSVRNEAINEARLAALRECREIVEGYSADNIETNVLLGSIRAAILSLEEKEG